MKKTFEDLLNEHKQHIDAIDANSLFSEHSKLLVMCHSKVVAEDFLKYKLGQVDFDSAEKEFISTAHDDRVIHTLCLEDVDIVISANSYTVNNINELGFTHLVIITDEDVVELVPPGGKLVH